MRHLKRTAKLGRTSEHRKALLANLVCSLIRHRRITTTLAKAKAARPVAEKMVTLGKRGTVSARRLAAARLQYKHQRMLKSKELGAKARANDVIRILFDEIAPTFKERQGGYTRIIKKLRRQGDAAEMAILEWVQHPVTEATPAKAESESKPESKPAEQPKPDSEAK